MSTLFVLTAVMDNGEQRPVAVVSDEAVADQWIQEGGSNDWIPFELDDISLTSLSKDQKTPFQPKPIPPTPESVRQIMTSLQQSNQQLLDMVATLKGRLGSMQKRRASAASPQNILLCLPRI